MKGEKDAKNYHGFLYAFHHQYPYPHHHYQIAVCSIQLWGATGSLFFCLFCCSLKLFSEKE